MNHRITPTSPLSDLVPACRDIAESRGLKSLCRDFELEDTVLRAGGFAWDIGAEAAPLHAQIAQSEADAAAAEAARLQDLIDNPPPVPPYRVTRDTIWQRLKASVGTPTAHAIVNGFTAEQRNEWFSNDYFMSDNADVIALCGVLNLDPAVLLAPEGP